MDSQQFTHTIVQGGFSSDNGNSNENNVKKQKVLKVKQQIFACVARFLVHFFAVNDLEVNSFKSLLTWRFLEDMKMNTRTLINFFFPSSNLGAVP